MSYPSVSVVKAPSGAPSVVIWNSFIHSFIHFKTLLRTTNLWILSPSVDHRKTSEIQTFGMPQICLCSQCYLYIWAWHALIRLESILMFDDCLYCGDPKARDISLVAANTFMNILPNILRIVLRILWQWWLNKTATSYILLDTSEVTLSPLNCSIPSIQIITRMLQRKWWPILANAREREMTFISHLDRHYTLQIDGGRSTPGTFVSINLNWLFLYPILY